MSLFLFALLRAAVTSKPLLSCCVCCVCCYSDVDSDSDSDSDSDRLPVPVSSNPRGVHQARKSHKYVKLQRSDTCCHGLTQNQHDCLAEVFQVFTCLCILWSVLFSSWPQET